MCGGQPAPDNSAEVARIEAQAAREAREQAAAREAAERSEFDNRLNSAFGGGLQSARDYFSSRGLDPDEYASAITQRAQNTRGSVPIGDQNPMAYFENLGQTVYESQREAARNKAMRGLDTFAPAGFASKRITSDVDDATIEAILAEQMQTAEQYVRNLLDRGVVTNSGFDAAVKNLTGQRAGANSRLQELGLGVLESGRSGAENIIADARSQASNLDLGQQFDPFEYQQQTGNYFADFFNNLGTKLRGVAPTNLFDTAGLAGIAGAAQGAQNTNFNPAALAGIFDEEEEDEDAMATSPF